MVGIDNAGKTTILYQLKMNEKVHSIPTIGFNVESVDYKGLIFSVWDVGGQDKIRVLWKHYFNGMDGIIFVVDCNDKDRAEESAEELGKLMKEEELSGLPLLVMANKQDLKDAISPKEVGEICGLSKEKRKWMIQGTSASTGQGLKEGLDWMAETLLKGKK